MGSSDQLPYSRSGKLVHLFLAYRLPMGVEVCTLGGIPKVAWDVGIDQCHQILVFHSHQYVFALF